MPSAFRRSGGSNQRRVLPSGNSESSLPNGPLSSSLSSSSNRNPIRSSIRPVLRGVKPWQGGSYLTSVGLNDLDSILGGGQVLGTSIVLEEDRLWTRDLAITLVKYWCAEAISQDQHLLAPLFTRTPPSDDSLKETDDGHPSISFLFQDEGWLKDGVEPLNKTRDELNDLLSSLPRNLHWDKQKKKEQKAKRDQEVADAAGAADISSGLGSISLGPIAILEEGEEDEEKEADDGLQVAWQYKKSVQQERLAKSKSNAVATAVVTDVFCHSYDLSARMKDQTDLDSSACITNLSLATGTSGSSHTKGYRLFYELVQMLKERMLSNSEKAVRLLLYHPPLELLAIALPLLLAHIRKESLAVVLMICTTPTADVESKIRLSRVCDVVLSTEGFVSRKEFPPPAEFRHLQGVLKISKSTRKRTEMAASIYGFKRDRRKLHIPLLHIPPEDYAEGGGSVSGGVRSGAGRPGSSKSETGDSQPRKSSGGGMGCSSNMSGSLLDF